MEIHSLKNFLDSNHTKYMKRYAFSKPSEAFEPFYFLQAIKINYFEGRSLEIAN